MLRYDVMWNSEQWLCCGWQCPTVSEPPAVKQQRRRRGKLNLTIGSNLANNWVAAMRYLQKSERASRWTTDDENESGFGSSHQITEWK
mmetsp:Transcript_9912/g.29773  ORF Transcript_9912/g.29773 Transcript_9912/m.29773 type:complete len:88 (-) Transcript_9912:4001-4264(-)